MPLADASDIEGVDVTNHFKIAIRMGFYLSASSSAQNSLIQIKTKTSNYHYYFRENGQVIQNSQSYLDTALEEECKALR